MTDGFWVADRPDIRVDSLPNPAIAILKEQESMGERITSKTSTNSEPLLDAQVATQSTDNNESAQAHSDRCRVRIEECLRITPQGAERLGRRRGVINEALAAQSRLDKEALSTHAG